jgi:hypothetical protein
MYSEGESDSAVADQNVKIVREAENILNFYISRAHLIKRRAQVCYDHNMPMRLVKTALIWSTNQEVDKKGIEILFLTDIRNENLECCKKILQEIKRIEMRHMEGVKGNLLFMMVRRCFYHFL